jgi:ABC-type transporter Mla MlaB component
LLRIEVLASDGRTVRAAGRLAGPWVAELSRALNGLSPASPVDLDLTQVSFADADGVALLRSLRQRGSVHLRCSPFLDAQLA